jgi:aspartate/methionine/tyrosine aminotransferase
MEIGEPDFATPELVRRAGAQAIERGDTFYTPALGLPSLRQAIAAFYRSRYGVTVAAERIIITPGASGALLLATAALVNPGDEVLLADPGYPANRHFVRLMDGVPVGIAVGRTAITSCAVNICSSTGAPEAKPRWWQRRRTRPAR